MRVIGQSRQNNLLAKIKYDLPLTLLCVPTLIYIICFNYLPIFGTVIAFKDYNYMDGILGSEWAGFKYFQYFFTSNDVGLVLRNTILYNLLFLILKQLLCVIVAILLYEISSKACLKFYQTSIILPNFISWVLVAYIGYALFATDTGLLNALIEKAGGQAINWYSTTKYWPAILTIFEMWKGVGIGCIIYYAALMGLDSSLFEAAAIDGAGRFKQVLCISLPSLMPTICIMLILGVGGIMGGDFGLFFQVPRNSGALYPVTDVISTYTYRGLVSGDLSQSAAVGLFQNLVGLILTLGTNYFVKKLDPDSAMF